VREIPFEVAVAGGSLAGHRAEASSPPALLLHGGPGLADYMEGCASELAGLFATIRYTQRGTPPSAGGPPYTVESHAADAIAVLDHFELDRAWAVGHSWGAHLALHLLTAHPQRLVGVVCIGTLGAFREALGEREAERRRRRAQRVLQRADSRFGVECSKQTNASIAEHFKHQTLRRALPKAWLPALFVHGTDDPFPAWSAKQTAALIPGAQYEEVERCGHFPWVDRPGALRQRVETFLATVGSQLER
jgi:proline iminopeptidase